MSCYGCAERGERLGCAAGRQMVLAASSFASSPATCLRRMALKPPVRWGTEAGIKELLGEGAASIAIAPRRAYQYYRSVDHALEVFGTHLGPVSRAMQTLDASNQASLRRDLVSFLTAADSASDGTLVLAGEYIEIVVRRR